MGCKGYPTGSHKGNYMGHWKADDKACLYAFFRVAAKSKASKLFGLRLRARPCGLKVKASKINVLGEESRLMVYALAFQA